MQVNILIVIVFGLTNSLKLFRGHLMVMDHDDPRSGVAIRTTGALGHFFLAKLNQKKCASQHIIKEHNFCNC